MVAVSEFLKSFVNLLSGEGFVGHTLVPVVCAVISSLLTTLLFVRAVCKGERRRKEKKSLILDTINALQGDRNVRIHSDRIYQEIKHRFRNKREFTALLHEMLALDKSIEYDAQGYYLLIGWENILAKDRKDADLRSTAV